MGVEYIKKRKKELKMTTKELSERSVVPVGTLNKILAGQTADPKLTTLKAICGALDISLTALNDYEAQQESCESAADKTYSVVAHKDDAGLKEQFEKILPEDAGHKVVSVYCKLNDEGRERLLAYAEELAEIMKYKKES